MIDIADKIYAATGLTLNAEAAAKIGQMIQAENEKLRAALRGVLTYYNAPTPAEAKLKKAVLATPIEQARAALGEKE
jgi:hypothetical protein